jgi:hypothetical protein
LQDFLAFGKEDYPYVNMRESIMRKPPMLAAMLLLAGFCLNASGQSSEPALGQDRGAKERGTKNQQAVAPPVTKQIFRPKLLLQDALKIAEGFIDQQHIDISQYWLYRSAFMLMGDEKTADKDKLPGWHFLWVNDNGAMGDYVEIFVTMDGKASRMPSM